MDLAMGHWGRNNKSVGTKPTLEMQFRLETRICVRSYVIGLLANNG